MWSLEMDEKVFASSPPALLSFRVFRVRVSRSFVAPVVVVSALISLGVIDNRTPYNQISQKLAARSQEG